MREKSDIDVDFALLIGAARRAGLGVASRNDWARLGGGPQLMWEWGLARPGEAEGFVARASANKSEVRFERILQGMAWMGARAAGGELVPFTARFQRIISLPEEWDADHGKYENILAGWPERARELGAEAFHIKLMLAPNPQALGDESAETQSWGLAVLPGRALLDWSSSWSVSAWGGAEGADWARCAEQWEGELLARELSEGLSSPHRAGPRRM